MDLSKILINRFSLAKALIVFFFFHFLLFANIPKINAQENNPTVNTAQQRMAQPKITYFKARIKDILPNQQCKITNDDKCYLFIVSLLNRPNESNSSQKPQELRILVDYRNSPYLKYLNLEKGDIVIVQHQDDLNNIIGIDRTKSVIFLSVIFLLVIFAISGLQGIGALTGLIITFALLVFIYIPAILQGYNPYFITALVGFISLAISVYFSHGFNLKSHIVFISTSIALTLAWIFAIFAITITKLTGLTSEEYVSLNASLPHPLDISKILAAVIILGVLGSIDDVAINQAAFITSLAKHKPQLTGKELYKEALAIGRDHAASMINTLAIVYVSNALPIVLILSASGVSLLEILNRELFVQEIVKSIVVSSILLITLPLTNVVAIFFVKRLKGKLT